MTVAELLHRMSSRELSEWMAHDALDREDRLRADLDRQARAGLATLQRRPLRRRPGG
jgi:hypothetical protein